MDVLDDMQNSPWHETYDQEYYPMGTEFVGFDFPVINEALEVLGWRRDESVQHRSVHVHRNLSGHRSAVVIEEAKYWPQIAAEHDVVDVVDEWLATR